MQVLSVSQFLKDADKYSSLIKKGAVFIYPTDTIYGIGCDATNPKAVQRIRHMKVRDDKPFSVIAPAKSWIESNCMLYGHEEELGRLPGPFTLIVEVRAGSVSQDVNPGSKMLGVRIPDNWFSSYVSDQLDIPIVTTSVNKAGEPFMTSLEDCDKDILSKVDFIIYEGQKKGLPSTLIKISEIGVEEIKRSR
jgi:L-threonylcarbamoyladenylate synthase